ncbi:hypothetical protein AGMMS49983_06300 [Clostridia bacterium]|nr:hypothetical protein AGMMS49983_06300 [Clostridia bacterium]
MNKRQDILNVFLGKDPEYVPWFGDLAYWIDYLLDEGIMPEKYTESEYGTPVHNVSQGVASPFTGNGLHQLHHDLGVGFYLQAYFPFSVTYDLEVVTTEENNRRITTYKTPYGDLQEIWEYVYDTHSWGPRSQLVKNWKDLKAVRYLYENSHYAPDYVLAQTRIDKVGDDGIVLAYTPKSPFMEFVALKAGIEAVTYMYLDAQEEFEETLTVMLKKQDEAVRIAIDSPAECIFVPDNITSESIGSFYNTYMKDVHEKWIRWIRDAGKVSFCHLDGTLKPCITDLSKSGFDVIEGITPRPVGDIAIEDLRSYVQDKTITWGGIPGGFFTKLLSDDEFDEFVIAAIENMKNNNRCVLGVGDQVSPGATFERIARVNELVEKYGKYDKK